ncbi:hypothetical protein [Tropicibacter sp. S64]|uniref:hypothetical protein n=1 Tax=Tropicibacter sp. S64 TaxID=3415122 RepID=UPI003C7D713F
MSPEEWIEIIRLKARLASPEPKPQLSWRLQGPRPEDRRLPRMVWISGSTPHMPYPDPSPNRRR